MTHQAEIGLEFLRWLYPLGPWVLTAINQEQTSTPTRTFTPGQEDQLSEWLFQQAQWNIYYHVNKPTHILTKKAEREDIKEVCFLHVDVDPRTGEDFESEKERIQKALTDNLPAGLPPPSAVIFSGGGYNALWRLETPIPIADETLSPQEVTARYEDAKRYNLQLEIMLGGDNCHNIDRILRLPGSTNWPNAKKRAKGRKPAISRIVKLSDKKYDISKFIPAPPIQQKGGGIGAGGGVKVHVSGNVKRLEQISELGPQVSDRIKMIIVQGMDPDEPNKFGTSRSEWLFLVCCALVRAGITDEVIYSVITDEGFLISASVLDKGSSAERYALRQIQRAREDAINPALRELNEKHAVIGNTGGRCRIIEEVMDHALKRPRLTMQSFEDFRNRYMADKVQTGVNPKSQEPVFQQMGQWWLQNPNRRQFEALVFVPGREVPGSYNLWQGFDCQARPGDKHEGFLRHIRETVCQDEPVYFNYLVKWMARAVQYPATQGEVAIVFRGDQGVGKGAVAREFGKLWGRHFLQISDPKHLVGSFNAHLRDAVVVFADEAFYAGDKKHESILKTLITEDLLAIEGKGRDMETGRNYVHLMMASNHNWVVPAGLNERRYCVLDVLPTRMRDRNYWPEFFKAMDEGGRENLLHYLLTLDLTGFEVRDVPQTEGLREQKLLSFSTEQEWWYQKLENGALTRGHIRWTAPIFKDTIVDDYLLYAQKLGVNKRATATAIGRFLHTVTPTGWPKSRQMTKQYETKEGHRMLERQYAYEFPPLDECRKLWDEKFSGPYPWPPEEENPNGTSQQESAF